MTTRRRTYDSAADAAELEAIRLRAQELDAERARNADERRRLTDRRRRVVDRMRKRGETAAVQAPAQPERLGA